MIMHCWFLCTCWNRSCISLVSMYIVICCLLVSAVYFSVMLLLLLYAYFGDEAHLLFVLNLSAADCFQSGFELAGCNPQMLCLWWSCCTYLARHWYRSEMTSCNWGTSWGVLNRAPLSMLRCRSRYEADLVVALVSFVLTSMGLDAINKITFSRIV